MTTDLTNFLFSEKAIVSLRDRSSIKGRRLLPLGLCNDIDVIKVFSNEMGAAMAQQLLENLGIQAFVFKEDASGLEPQLQRTSGVRLVTAHAETEFSYLPTTPSPPKNSPAATANDLATESIGLEFPPLTKQIPMLQIIST